MANKKKVPKPRHKELHEVLLSRPSGKMKDKRDVSRSKEKEQLRKKQHEILSD